jgi:hypothetical protein
MNKKNLAYRLVLGLLIIGTLMFSGCNSLPTVSVSNIQKTFKKDIGSELLKSAVVKAATSNGWQVLSTQNARSGLHLKKLYLEKKRRYFPPSKRWRKTTTEHEVYLKVKVNDKSFEIQPTKENRDFWVANSNREKLNNDLVKLEKSIYWEIVSKAL